MKQKRLILCNLKEAYYKFKEENSTVKIGFNKFAMLRPKECVLAGSSGTHCICVCLTHKNMEFMCYAINHIVADIKNEKDLLQSVSCTNYEYKCARGQCPECNDLEELFFIRLQNEMDRHNIFEIIYNSWVMQDRCYMEKVLSKRRNL